MLAINLVSCGTGYNADFAREVAAMPDSPNSAQGPWKGEWKSDVNGHRGPLWCILSQGEAGKWDFRYRAGWGVLEFGDYTHTLEVEEKPDGSLVFDGGMDLPGGVGFHTVKGTVSNESFQARYTSEHGDHGAMILDRP